MIGHVSGSALSAPKVAAVIRCFPWNALVWRKEGKILERCQGRVFVSARAFCKIFASAFSFSKLQVVTVAVIKTLLLILVVQEPMVAVVAVVALVVGHEEGWNVESAIFTNDGVSLLETFTRICPCVFCRGLCTEHLDSQFRELCPQNGEVNVRLCIVLVFLLQGQ